MLAAASLALNQRGEGSSPSGPIAARAATHPELPLHREGSLPLVADGVKKTAIEV